MKHRAKRTYRGQVVSPGGGVSREGAVIGHGAWLGGGGRGEKVEEAARRGGRGLPLRSAQETFKKEGKRRGTSVKRNMEGM